MEFYVATKILSGQRMQRLALGFELRQKSERKAETRARRMIEEFPHVTLVCVLDACACS
jgi:hypothetical protein